MIIKHKYRKQKLKCSNFRYINYSYCQCHAVEVYTVSSQVVLYKVVPWSSRTHTNSYTSQLLTKSSRTQVTKTNENNNIHK